MTAFMEAALRRAKMLREWRTWVQHIARITREILPDAQVYVTGSTVRGDQVGGSDVDVLIISQNIPEKAIEKAKIKAVIEEKLNLPPYHPFEIHLLTPKEAQPYLKTTKQLILKISK